MNLFDLFDETARRQPLQPAILGPAAEDCLTYAQLATAIDEASNHLRAAGLHPGACVALHCPSGTDYIIFTYAIWRCGACVVPIPVELTNAEKRDIVGAVAFSFLLTVKKPASFMATTAAAEIAMGRGAVLMAIKSSRPLPIGFESINGAFIRWTSGTTGTAKGVVLSHETIRDRYLAANEVLRIGPNDRVVWLLSMSYHFAVTIVGYLSLGAAIILPANHFADAIMRSSQQHAATIIYASPAHFGWLADSSGDGRLLSVRLAISTTSALDRRIAEKFHRRFGRPLTQALGIIEVGLPFINTDFAASRPDGVGRPLPAYRLWLREAGLGPGLNEVHLCGPGFLDAYYEPWQTRAEVMPDGWFATGDVGDVDEDGCLFLRGRTKDVISVLGAKFFPREVEAVLRTHPSVADVSVYAVADERLGEAPWARVVLADPDRPLSEEELLRYCRQRLATFKVPHRIEFVQHLPRTASGKVLRRHMAPQRDTP